MPDVPQGKELSRLKQEEDRAHYRNLELVWAKRKRGGAVNVVIDEGVTGDEGDEEG